MAAVTILTNKHTERCGYCDGPILPNADGTHSHDCPGDTLFPEPPIYVYTAERAVDDGFLVKVPAHMSREAGFEVPVLLTAAVQRYVEVPAGLEGCQDYTGRLWDVLWIARSAFLLGDQADRMRTNIGVLFLMAPGRQDYVTLWGVIDGAGLTLMLPEDY